MKKLLLECEKRLAECREYVLTVSQNTLYGDSDDADTDLIDRIEETLENIRLTSKGRRINTINCLCIFLIFSLICFLIYFLIAF